VPVDRQDAYQLGERPVVATWQAIRYDDLPGWKRRIDALVGGPGFFGAEDRAADLGELRAAYDALTVEQITALARRFHADCVVATTTYPLPVIHRVGGTIIYRVPVPAAP
jgi:hypothetical protein